MLVSVEDQTPRIYQKIVGVWDFNATPVVYIGRNFFHREGSALHNLRTTMWASLSFFDLDVKPMGNSPNFTPIYCLICGKKEETLEDRFCDLWEICFSTSNRTTVSTFCKSVPMTCQTHLFHLFYFIILRGFHSFASIYANYHLSVNGAGAYYFSCYLGGKMSPKEVNS